MRKGFLILYVFICACLQAEETGDITRLGRLGFAFPADPVSPPALIAYDGENPVSLTRQNRVTVLYFWSTLIPSSLTDLLLLDSLQKEMAGQDILFAPVNLNESRNLVLSIAVTMKLSLTMYCYPDREALTPYIMKSVPAAYILDRRGMLAASIQGNAPWDDPEMKRTLEELTGGRH